MYATGRDPWARFDLFWLVFVLALEKMARFRGCPGSRLTQRARDRVSYSSMELSSRALRHIRDGARLITVLMPRPGHVYESIQLGPQPPPSFAAQQTDMTEIPAVDELYGFLASSDEICCSSAAGSGRGSACGDTPPPYADKLVGLDRVGGDNEMPFMKRRRTDGDSRFSRFVGEVDLPDRTRHSCKQLCREITGFSTDMEPLLTKSKRRFVLYPIQYPEVGIVLLFSPLNHCRIWFCRFGACTSKLKPLRGLRKNWTLAMT